MKAIAIEKSPEDNKVHEIVNISFNIDILVATVDLDDYMLDIRFDHPVGFRVLDEGDLLDFWPTCSSNNGWLYQILTDGWFEQESKRKGFIASHNEGIKEYFITGTNFCLNVLAFDPPTVEQSIRVARDY